MSISSYDLVEWLLEIYERTPTFYASEVSNTHWIVSATKRGYLKKVGKRDNKKGQCWSINFHGGVFRSTGQKQRIKDIEFRRNNDQIVRQEEEFKHEQSSKTSTEGQTTGL